MVTNTRTYPGADCTSDHVPLVIDVRLRLKKPKKKKQKPKINLKMSNDKRIENLYSISVRNKYDVLMNYEEGSEVEEPGAKEQFCAFKEALDSANEEV